MTHNDSRARFEKWLADNRHGSNVKFNSGEYIQPDTQLAWLAFIEGERGKAKVVTNSELELIIEELVEQQSESGQAPQWSPIWESARRVLAKLKGTQ